MSPKLIYLGTGAGSGLPSFYCNCAACQEARGESRYGRSRCAILLRGEQNTLIDAPPDLRAQLVREGVGQIDHFILTHSHYDHSGGLGDLELYIRVARKEALPAIMTPATSKWLHTTCGYLEDCFYIQNVDNGWRFDLDGIRYTALEVTHAAGTIGLLLETAEKTHAAYITDTGPLPASTRAILEGVDTLILGATFWGRNWMPEDHLSIEEAVQIAMDLKARNVYLTHLSMHHDTPITSRELEAFLSRYGSHFHLAYDGLCIQI